jgi:hypothetical protein
LLDEVNNDDIVGIPEEADVRERRCDSKRRREAAEAFQVVVHDWTRGTHDRTISKTTSPSWSAFGSLEVPKILSWIM